MFFLFVTTTAIGRSAVFNVTVATLMMKSAFESWNQTIGPMTTVAAWFFHAGVMTITAIADRGLVLSVVKKHGFFFDIRHFDNFRDLKGKGAH